MASVGAKTMPRLRRFILDVSAFCAIRHRCAKLRARSRVSHESRRVEKRAGDDAQEAEQGVLLDRQAGDELAEGVDPVSPVAQICSSDDSIPQPAPEGQREGGRDAPMTRKNSLCSSRVSKWSGSSRRYCLRRPATACGS